MFKAGPTGHTWAFFLALAALALLGCSLAGDVCGFRRATVL